MTTTANADQTKAVRSSRNLWRFPSYDEFVLVSEVATVDHAEWVSSVGIYQSAGHPRLTIGVKPSGGFAFDLGDGKLFSVDDVLVSTALSRLMRGIDHLPPPDDIFSMQASVIVIQLARAFRRFRQAYMGDLSDDGARLPLFGDSQKIPSVLNKSGPLQVVLVNVRVRPSILKQNTRRADDEWQKGLVKRQPDAAHEVRHPSLYRQRDGTEDKPARRKPLPTTHEVQHSNLYRQRDSAEERPARRKPLPIAHETAHANLRRQYERSLEDQKELDPYFMAKKGSADRAYREWALDYQPPLHKHQTSLTKYTDASGRVIQTIYEESDDNDDDDKLPARVATIHQRPEPMDDQGTWTVKYGVNLPDDEDDNRMDDQGTWTVKYGVNLPDDEDHDPRAPKLSGPKLEEID